MAIEIVERGKLPEEKPLRGTCRNCRTVVKCLKGDASCVTDPRDGDTCCTVRCPVCSRDIVVQ